MKLSLLLATGLLVILTGPARANIDLATKHGCMVCHQVDTKLVGPTYSEVAEKYKDHPEAVKNLSDKVKAGGKEVWGPIPMPPNPNIKHEDIEALVKWILTGANRN